MATGAAGDGIFRGVFEGSISGHDLEISKRPYHRNCGCALHKSRGNCSHSSRNMNVSYPIRRSWSEGCLSLVAAASAAASGHSSPCSSPAVAVADVSKRNLLPVNEDTEDLVFCKITCEKEALKITNMEFHDLFSQELALQQQNADDVVSDQSMNFSVKLSQQYSDELVNNDNNNNNNNNNSNIWDEREKYKADIMNHHLSEQLLSAHVGCLRIATPVDQLPRIDEQLTESEKLVAKYYAIGQSQRPIDDKDLDQFMAHYVLLLSSFKEQLQQHVRVHAMEAVMACWELDQSLQNLTGVASGEGTGATMSDDDEDNQLATESETNFYYNNGILDNGASDNSGFGPLVPTENERFLMERVRQELKQEFKQGYKEKIVDIREEILRKRRAGKLPGDTTSALKAWWKSHSKWPYPTEEDKAKLVQETGLQLKQVNNWFINQRKRNWHTTPSSSSTQKSKRKSAGEKSRNDHFT